MLIRTIDYQASKNFLLFLQDLSKQHSSAWRLAVIRGKYLGAYDKNKFTIALKKLAQAATNVQVFFMDNRDIYVLWQGRIDSGELTALVTTNFARTGLDVRSDEVIKIKDPHAEINELFLSVTRDSGLMITPSGAIEKIPEKPATLPKVISGDQLEIFKNAIKLRKTRKRPIALVVEDQAFSRKLLCGMLERSFVVLSADNALLAWEIFLDNAPEIVFLDIELPNITGHELAKTIKDTLPETYVIMVTGNNSLEDVKRAQVNKVDGFIVKPFSKQKIIHCFEKFKGLSQSVIKGM